MQGDQDLRDGIRYSLSDRSGSLCFEAFDVVGVPGAEPLAEQVREMVVGRPLEAVDVEAIQRLGLRHNGRYARAVARAISECQALFAWGQGQGTLSAN